MLVEAAWAAAKTPGPLHAFFVRIRAKRGHQVAAVAVARNLAVLVWHMLTKETDYLWARPSLVAHKMRGMELQAGKPQKKGNSRGPAYAYNVKELRNREILLAGGSGGDRAHGAAVARPPSPHTRGVSPPLDPVADRLRLWRLRLKVGRPWRLTALAQRLESRLDLHGRGLGQR